LVSVSNSRLPGRTCPSGRWLAVVAEVALAAARSVIAVARAWLAARVDGGLAAAAGLAGPNSCGVDGVGDAALGGDHLGSGGADLVAGEGFRGVGDHPGRVVGGVGVAVKAIQGEAFAGGARVLTACQSCGLRIRGY
jgi:hypothetical protein